MGAFGLVHSIHRPDSGPVPFICESALDLSLNDTVTIKDFANKLKNGDCVFEASISGEKTFALALPDLTESEREILLDGCLINSYRRKAVKA